MKSLIPLFLAASPVWADEPVVDQVTYDGGTFSVTLSHPDTGWEHYADGWRVELADGTVLGTRELVHPHVEEQPFMRSLSGVIVQDGISRVFVRARCNVDGWSVDALPFDLN